MTLKIIAVARYNDFSLARNFSYRTGCLMASVEQVAADVLNQYGRGGTRTRDLTDVNRAL
jgi:hypothetical protein